MSTARRWQIDGRLITVRDLLMVEPRMADPTMTVREKKPTVQDEMRRELQAMLREHALPNGARCVCAVCGRRRTLLAQLGSA